MSTRPLEPPTTRWLYDRAPVWAQNAMASAYGLTKIRARYGREQRRWKTFFEASAAWSESDLAAYRRQQLRRTIHHAYDHVPFYRRWFREAGVRPDDIRDVDDLTRLPLLDKPTVARAGDEMLAEGVDRIRGRFGFEAITAGASIDLLGRFPQNRNGFVLKTPSLTK